MAFVMLPALHLLGQGSATSDNFVDCLNTECNLWMTRAKHPVE